MKLLLGHALTELEKLEDKSIDMMITSPPYYGLRNYGTEPIIWGGEKNCQHQWGEVLSSIISPCKHHLRTEIHIGAGCKKVQKQSEITNDPKNNSGQFCQLCNAWIGELGSEPTIQLYIQHLIMIFDEVYRVLKDTGTCWINIADSYNATQPTLKKDGKIYGQQKWYGEKSLSTVMDYKRSKQNMPSKSQLCVPERLVLSMIDQGWIKRNTIIWHKPSCLPQSAKDRFTNDFEYLFFFVKNENYYFEQQFEPQKDWGSRDRTNGKYVGVSHSADGLTGKVNPEGRNKRAVWSINPAHTKEAHFATFPEELITTPIKAGCPEGGVVLDPFAGIFTTGIAAYLLHRDYILIEWSKEYFEQGKKRLEKYTNQERIF